MAKNLFAFALSLVLTSTAKSHNFDDPKADHTSAAIAFANAGNMDDGIRAFQSAARFKPNHQTNMNLGVALMRTNRLDEADVSMKTALRMAPASGSQREELLENMEALEQHFRHRRGEPIHGPPQQKQVNRPQLVHQRPLAARGKSFRRVSWADLDGDALGIGSEPFVITDLLMDWFSRDMWPATWKKVLADNFPEAVVDFYPYNMLKSSSPYLARVARGLKELMHTGKDAHFPDRPGQGDLEGRYLHLQLTPSMWNKLEDLGNIPAKRHPFLLNDEWQRECMGPLDGEVAAEWNLKTHWKIILIGTRGAGMHNHSDSLRTASWHAHVAGKKWWYVCGTLQNGSDACFEDVLQRGDILYYPRDWHHETQCLETPTVTITDTVMHLGNAEGIFGKTNGECTGRDSLFKFDFSAQLCDALDKCTKWWKKKVKSAGRTWGKEAKLAPWRKRAVPGRVEQAEKMSPRENNYDGRNYILENDNGDDQDDDALEHDEF